MNPNYIETPTAVDDVRDIWEGIAARREFMKSRNPIVVMKRQTEIDENHEIN